MCLLYGRAAKSCRTCALLQVDLKFTGSGVSTVLQFLKPLIQSALNKRLTESRQQSWVACE